MTETTEAAPLPGRHSAAVLLVRALKSARSPRYNKRVKHARWIAVMDSVEVGSTYAYDLCRWAGLDPYEQVAR